MEQKINEIFAEDSQMKAKLLSILIQHNSDNSEAEDNYYYSESTDSEYASSPLPVVNVITTTKSQKEFLLDLIGQIPDGNLKKEYLEKLKQLILEEEDKTPKFSLEGSSPSLMKIYKQFQFRIHFNKLRQKIYNMK